MDIQIGQWKSLRGVKLYNKIVPRGTIVTVRSTKKDEITGDYFLQIKVGKNIVPVNVSFFLKHFEYAND